MPKATFEEGTELVVDSETVAYAAGWTDSPASDVFRIGPRVDVVVRAKNAAKAAALICTLPVEYRPAVAILSTDGKLEVKTNGEVVAKNSEVELESAAVRRYEASFRAAGVSP